MRACTFLGNSILPGLPHATLLRNTMSIQSNVSERITVLRPLLILGVVYVHTGGVGDYLGWEWNNPLEYLLAVFRNGFFRAGVPTLTLIAGFLLYRAGLDQAPKKLFAKKFRTLAIPFLVFNLLFIAIVLPLEILFGFTSHTSLLGSSFGKWLDHLFALRHTPFNYPLYFLRDMLVLVALAPLLGLALRKAPLIGLAVMAGVFLFDLDGYLVLRDTSALMFYIGGMAALYRWNLLALDKYAKPCALLVVVACLAAVALRTRDTTWLVMVLPFLIWPAAALLHGTRIAAFALKYSRYTFFIFVAHMPVLSFAWEFVIHHARFIPFPVYFLFAPLLTVAFLIGVYRLAMRHTPALLSFAIGERDQQIAHPPGQPAPARTTYQNAR